MIPFQHANRLYFTAGQQLPLAVDPPGVGGIESTGRRRKSPHLAAIKNHTGKSPSPFLSLFPWPSPSPGTAPLSLLVHK